MVRLWSEKTNEDTSILMHNFWKWITDVHYLIAQYLLQFWKDGLITGFLSMNKAEWILNIFQPARHGTFILRFSEPDLKMGEALEYTHVHLKAYALEIKERNVSLYNLPTSNFRKLGKYFEEKIALEDVPRWKHLIQKRRLKISPSIKGHIEDAISPGIAFVEELKKKRYMIEDLAGCFKQHEMYEGLDILHAKEEHDSVLSVSYFTFREIGLAFERSYTVQVDDGEEIPCWKYIIRWNEEFSVVREHEVNIGKSSRPGEKFLDIFNDCGFKLTDLIKTCKDLGLDGITHIIESSKHDAYLEKTIVNVDIGGARELEKKGLLDILKEKQKTVGNLLLRYLYLGKRTQTLQQLQEKYTNQT
ncbi:uncharacterized protein LOC132729774 [Ruditapes philippinarum]|uniref:uncharacterized protein LOC132729774 n=1 Tax=Ruditapes philippinarum TaxID=129788 RepID=UPI00295AD40A|nr:uncharacterized protein LOC132729774 [Ruditapes philippinarum]